jgi:hypothetical protein
LTHRTFEDDQRGVFTGSFRRDDEGRLIFSTYSFNPGEIRYAVKLYNSKGWIHFEKGEPTSYGVFLRTRRSRGGILHQTFNIHRQSYILRTFAPNAGDDLRVFTLEDVEMFYALWDEETRTGFRNVPLTKLKLKQWGASTSSPVPLEKFYLGEYRRPENPEYRESLVKVRQVRKPRTPPPPSKEEKKRLEFEAFVLGKMLREAKPVELDDELLRIAEQKRRPARHLR